MNDFEKIVASFHKGQYLSFNLVNQRTHALLIFRIFETLHYHDFINQNGEAKRLILYGALDILISHVAFLRVTNQTNI